MMKSNFYEIDQDNLIADVYPPVSYTTVELASGQGILERGTLVGVDSTYKQGKPLGESFNFGGDVKAVFVLPDAVDTGESDPVNACVMATGCFIKDCLITEEDYELSDQDINEMRRFDIRVQDAMK